MRLCALLVLGWTGCGGLTCGSGTVEKDGACVADTSGGGGDGGGDGGDDTAEPSGDGGADGGGSDGGGSDGGGSDGGADSGGSEGGSGGADSGGSEGGSGGADSGGDGGDGGDGGGADSGGSEGGSGGDGDSGDGGSDSGTSSDADCDTLVTWSGDLTFEGFASDDMEAFCAAGYNAVEGKLNVYSVDSVEPLSCLCQVGTYLDINGGSFTSLDGFRNLRRVEGGLAVYVDTVSDISGFDSLETVEGSLSIGGEDLQDISGFPRLTSIGDGFNVPQFSESPLLADISGLNAVEEVTNVTIYNTGLEQLTGLNGLVEINHVSGDIEILQNAYLKTVTGLSGAVTVHRYVEIEDNPRLTDLSGLTGIAAIEGCLYIRDNTSLPTDDAEDLAATIGVSCSVISGNKD